MNPKFKTFCYKIYQSAQGLTIIIGVSFFIWNIVAGFHDVNISNKGRECVEGIVGADVLATQLKYTKTNWADALEDQFKTLDDPAKKYDLKKVLEDKCSKYLHITIYEYTGDVGVYTNNYMDGYPAIAKQRINLVLLTIGVTLTFLALFYGLMKWLSWLFKNSDNNQS